MSRRARALVLMGLLEHARYEVLPTPSVEDSVLAHLPRGATITVTASPSKGLEPSLALSERLARAGYVVVPHLAARMVTDRVELAEIVDRLTTAGIDQLFVPGGDAAPHGQYSDALGLLDDLAALGSPFRHVGIAGYPESHPTITDDVTVQAMWDKRRHATHVVSNLTFSPEALSKWLLRLRGRGVHIPVLIGIPGPVERAKLLAMATKIGVGESAQFLAKNKGLFARLTTPGGFTGERFLLDCARRLDLGAVGVEGLHIFTFNQVAQAELWRIRLLHDLRRQWRTSSATQPGQAQGV